MKKLDQMLIETKNQLQDCLSEYKTEIHYTDHDEFRAIIFSIRTSNIQTILLIILDKILEYGLVKQTLRVKINLE